MDSRRKVDARLLVQHPDEPVVKLLGCTQLDTAINVFLDR